MSEPRKVFGLNAQAGRRTYNHDGPPNATENTSSKGDAEHADPRTEQGTKCQCHWHAHTGYSDEKCEHCNCTDVKTSSGTIHLPNGTP